MVVLLLLFWLLFPHQMLQRACKMLSMISEKLGCAIHLLPSASKKKPQSIISVLFQCWKRRFLLSSRTSELLTLSTNQYVWMFSPGLELRLKKNPNDLIKSAGGMISSKCHRITQPSTRFSFCYPLQIYCAFPRLACSGPVNITSDGISMAHSHAKGLSAPAVGESQRLWV